MEFIYSDEIINNIKNNLVKTTKKNHYNGWSNRTNYGYHSFKIDNINFLGQRRPWIRLNKMKQYYNFDNKTLIDFGCNTGGMIFHLPELKRAIGLDYDKNCINSCNYMSSIINNNVNYTFITQDLNVFDFNTFAKNNNIEKVDVIFLLSIGSWVKEWKKLYEECVKYSNTIIFETNNDIEGKPQLELFKKLNCIITLISDNSEDDITDNFGRKTYLIKNK